MADSGSGSSSDSDFEAGEGNESSSSSSPSEDEGEGQDEGDEDEDEATGALGGRQTHLSFGLSERCGLKRDVVYSTRETSGLLFTFSCVC